MTTCGWICIFIGDIEDDIEELQANLNEVDSLFAAGNYSQAKNLLKKLKEDADEIKASVLLLQQSQDPNTNEDSYCGDGFCDIGESCDCSDCADEEKCNEVPQSGSSNTFIIIFIVLLVIIGGVILATSIVPDDWQEK